MLPRLDSWSEQDDAYLAKTVIHYIRHGKTQLQAFEDAADKLDRSAGACGFRWNNAVRQHYKEEIRIARRIRRGQKVDSSLKI